jgi:hypothetical protein
MSIDLQTVIAQLEGVRKNGAGYMARCPAHDDRTPSLSVSEGKNGGVVLHCHAGCTVEAITAALGMTPADLCADNGDAAKREIVGEYDYTDEAGKLLYQVVRFTPKDFRQRRLDGTGGWVWKLGDTRRVLYHLPDVIAAVEASAIVYVVEGEKDADRLHVLGLTATTNPGGAGKWKSEYSESLRGAHVVIVADKDEAGYAHAASIAASVTPLAASVRIVEAAVGKDASDHLAAGRTPEEFVEVSTAAAPHVRVYSLPELAAMQPEQVDWIAAHYLAAGDVGSLESPPKGGKSTLARNLACHVATGRAFLGEPVKCGPVLYCTEERLGTSREGFMRAGALGVAELHVMFLHDAWRLNWTERVEEMREHCRRLGVVLVVIDTLSKWAGLVGEEEQSSGAAMGVMGPLQRLAATGVAVLVIRHERKSGGATGEAGRGSSAFAGDLDVILSLRKVTAEPTRRKLGAVGRHDATPDEVVIDYVDGEYMSLGDPHALRRQEHERAIIDLLPTSRDEQVTLEDVRERMEDKASRVTVRNLLLRLVDEGVLSRAHGEIPGHSRADGYWLRGDDD